MNTLYQIRSAWLEETRTLLATSPILRRIVTGRVTESEYAAILTQLHLQVREHPQALALLALHLRGEERDLVKGILSHSLAETGHDELALDDLQALRVEVADVRSLRPLPATSAILGYMHGLLLRGPAIGFLGYLFHLEFLPTHFGEQLGQGLATAGIPRQATTFLTEHAEADIGHNRLMALYVDRLLTSRQRIDDVVYAARVTAQLYERMLAEAADNANAMARYGRDHAEIRDASPLGVSA